MKFGALIGSVAIFLFQRRNGREIFDLRSTQCRPWVFLAGVFLLSFGMTSLVAHEDVSPNKALISIKAEQAKLSVAMLTGEVPFDLAKAKALFGLLAEVADRLSGLYPDGPIAIPLQFDIPGLN